MRVGNTSQVCTICVQPLQKGSHLISDFFDSIRMAFNKTRGHFTSLYVFSNKENNDNNKTKQSELERSFI